MRVPVAVWQVRLRTALSVYIGCCLWKDQDACDVLSKRCNGEPERDVMSFKLQTWKRFVNRE